MNLGSKIYKYKRQQTFTISSTDSRYVIRNSRKKNTHTPLS